MAVVLDGKTYAQEAMVLALGITLQGQTKILGFVQTATENEPVCVAFLRALVERGWSPRPALRVIDEAKGLRTAIQTVFGAEALIQPCQWPKHGNVVRYLPKTLPTVQPGLRAADVGRGPGGPGPAPPGGGGATSPPWPD